MTGGEAAFLQKQVDGVGQGQQPEGVGHGGPGLAHPLGHLILGESILVHQDFIAVGFFDGVQVLPLEVFNEAQFHDGAVIGLDDDGGHLMEPGQLGRPPAAFPGDDLIVAGREAADGERLDDAMGADGVGQIGQALVVKAFAWLLETGLYL